MAEVGLFWWEMDLQHGTKATARNEVRLKERKNGKPEKKKKVWDDDFPLCRKSAGQDLKWEKGLIVAGSVIEKSMGFPIHFNSNFKHPEISSLGSYSNVRKKVLQMKRDNPLLSVGDNSLSVQDSY